jgi:UDP-glucose 4-epimerase
VARKLIQQGHSVVGADYRLPPADLDPRMAFYQGNYNKTRIEDVFKRHRFDVVLHLGRVGNLKEAMGKRFDLNVLGSQKIMNLCVHHGVKRVAVLSTFHIYGAHPSNHIPIQEDEPLRAGVEFPQIADAIQLDNMATQWVYQHRKVRTVVLRPANVVGPSIHNAVSRFLRRDTIPHLMGFNPMMQFVHEEDMADAVAATVKHDEVGVFNVAGAGEMPFLTALRLAGARTFPLPTPLVMAYLRAFSAFPAYLVNFFKYPCVIADARFRQAFRWQPRVSLEDSIRTTVAPGPPGPARAGVLASQSM